MRQYFSELKVGESIIMPVVFSAVTPRKTKANKPYLSLEAFDGRDKISGNYWDWAGSSKPELKTKVYNLAAQVSEWQGQKQLNITSISSNVDMSVTDFQPSSGLAMDEVFKEAWSFITDTVRDDLIRELVLVALDDFKSAWLTVPGALGVHHAYVGGTLIHSLAVAKVAKSISNQFIESHDDLCIAGAMLHDIGKLWTYELDGAVINMTTEGKLFEHAAMGLSVLDTLVAENLTLKNPADVMKIQILRHIILSHHGKLEHGAVVEPQCLEAHIVHLADMADATRAMIKEASDKTVDLWTDKVYALSNRPVMNYNVITALEATTYDDEALPFH